MYRGEGVPECFVIIQAKETRRRSFYLFAVDTFGVTIIGDTCGGGGGIPRAGTWYGSRVSRARTGATRWRQRGSAYVELPSLDSTENLGGIGGHG
jgi:hypothetical protein